MGVVGGDSGNNKSSTGAILIFSKCFAGGVGCGVAGLATNPFDVIKVRNQQYSISNNSGNNNYHNNYCGKNKNYNSFRGTTCTIFQEEGLRGFAKGASASVLRECTYSAMRMGLYEPIKLKYSTLLRNNNNNDYYENNAGCGSQSSSASGTTPTSMHSSSARSCLSVLSYFTSSNFPLNVFSRVSVKKVRSRSMS